MDSKKVIEKLVKIATQQQKIINKLAQIPVPPQSLPIAQDIGGPTALVKGLVPPQTAKAIMSLVGGGDSYTVEFAAGQNTQANYDAVLRAIAQLVKSAKLPPPSPGKAISLTAKEHMAPAAR